MTGKERVLRTMEFREPDRIPVCLNFDPSHALDKQYGEYICERYEADMLIASHYDPHFVPPEEGADEWGCVWGTMGHTMGEVRKNPLPEWDAYDEWVATLPDYNDPERYKDLHELRKQYPDTFLVGGMGMMMESIINFRGFENYMCDLYLERENLDKLIDLIYQKADQAISRYAEAGMDGLIAWEDWGLQDRLLLSLPMWREIFKPRMAAMIKNIHDHGMKYILHTCGYTIGLMDEFAEIGVDVLQLDQQRNMGLDALKKAANGRICFCCPGDIQFAPTASPEELKEYCEKMRDTLSTAKGGFIYKPYPQPEAIGMTLEQLEREVSFFSMKKGSSGV